MKWKHFCSFRYKKWYYFKKVKLSEFKIQRINKSYNGININSDDEVINVTLSNGLKNIVIITRNGLCSMYSENDIPIYSPKVKEIKEFIYH
ncbi:hypothetical protein NW070_03825 [Mycoplasmopsis cynos]|nr:hypothetical protein [Mycoplasmopsis cynos]UWV76935.1 hypothetical protein NW070_03825 [Mycoplasmopsis cynos]